MLVLSRRLNEDLYFPNTGIRVRLLRLTRTEARLGIEAPPTVTVLRGELAPAAAPAPDAPGRHSLRNQLNKVNLSLHLFERQWKAGHFAEAEATLERALAFLDALDRDWPADAQPPARCGRCHALLVEDDANERELLAGILTMNGCDCTSVADGQDALDYLAAHEPPELVLLDMGLPRVSGLQTLAQIRREPRCRGLKVFAISGADPAALGVPVGAGGVDAWFSKPLNPRRLWEAIRQGVGAVGAAN